MQAIKIFNAKTNLKQDLICLQPGVVKMYVCGMTTYDYCHVGHARVMVFFDVVVRVLRHAGYTVNYVRNITDVDDKIIARAACENITIAELTEKYINAMHADEQSLGNLSPDHEPKASENIQNMIELITTLLEKEHAYIGPDGAVWFAVDSYSNYGSVSGQNLAALQANIRKDMSAGKKSDLDFVLWKPAKTGEPAWDSPWGAGRPGWHIECSAMASDLLGFTIDIHGGGIDLKFPHHENETAQSVCGFGAEFVRNWLHVGHVTSGSEKMSKSLGNFITIRAALEQASGEAIRYLLLASHYRKPLPFINEKLIEAEKIIQRFYRALKAYPPADIKAKSKYIQEFFAALHDDFNVVQAMSICFELLKQIYTIGCTDKDQACALSADLRYMLRVLGFSMASPDKVLKNIGNLSEAEIERVIQERAKARAAKEWQLADELRDELLIEGIVLEDSALGTTWRSC